MIPTPDVWYSTGVLEVASVVIELTRKVTADQHQYDKSDTY